MAGKTLFRAGILALLAVGLLPRVAPAQESRELRLSLDECVRMALESNTQVIQSRYNRDIQDTNIDQQRNNFLPRLSTSYGYSQSVLGPREGSFQDPATGNIVTTLGESRTSGSQRAGASFSMSVFDASDFASLSASKKGHKAALMSLEESRQTVTFQVKQRYFQLLQAQSLADVQREQVRVSEENLRRSETLNEIGSAPISEVYSARANLESARVNLITRENDVETARLTLGFTLGVSPDVNVIPTETEFGVAPVTITYEEALERANTHPSLLASRFSMEQSKSSLRATQFSVRFPTVSMDARYSWSLSREEKFAGLEDLFLKNYQYNLGVNVNLPIFNGLVTETSVKRQKIQYLNSMEQYNQEKRQTAVSLKQSFLRLDLLRRSVGANEAAVKAAEQDFRLQDEAYNFGAGTFLQRQTAQVQLFTARSNLVRARYDYQIELANLHRLIGLSVDEDLVEQVTE